MAITISRRKVLRGLLNGAAVSIALPRFDFMLNGNGTAFAQGAPLPLRFGLWAWANGVRLDRWTPTATGANYPLSEALQPLAAVKEYVTVVSGTNLPFGGRVHAGPNTVFMTGQLPAGGNNDSALTAAKASIDQEIAGVIGKTTAIKSLEIGICNAPSNEGGTSFRWWSHNGPDSPNQCVYDSKAVFNRLFGTAVARPATPATGTGTGTPALPAVDLALEQRKSVLDAVRADAADLNKLLGARDRARLEQHLEGIRSIESRLTMAPPVVSNPAQCKTPAAPTGVGAAGDYDATYVALNKTMADLAAMAFACDLTRVLTYQIVHPGTEMGMKAVTNSAAVRTYNAHNLSHAPDGIAIDAGPLHMIVVHYMKELAVLVQALKSFPEGAGTVLDNCALIATNDCTDGPSHDNKDYPVLVIGKAGGKLRSGIHYRGTGGTTLAVPLTIAHVLGHPMTSFGAAGGTATAPLSGIMT